MDGDGQKAMGIIKNKMKLKEDSNSTDSYSDQSSMNGEDERGSSPNGQEMRKNETSKHYLDKNQSTSDDSHAFQRLVKLNREKGIKHKKTADSNDSPSNNISETTPPDRSETESITSDTRAKRRDTFANRYNPKQYDIFFDFNTDSYNESYGWLDITEHLTESVALGDTPAQTKYNRSNLVLWRICEEEPPHTGTGATLDEYHVDEVHLLQNKKCADLDFIDNLIYQLERDTERIKSEITTQFARQETADRNFHRDRASATINQKHNPSSITRQRVSKKTAEQNKDTSQTDNKDTSAEPRNRQHHKKKQRKKQQKENRRSKQQREDTGTDKGKRQKRRRNSNQRSQYRDGTANHDNPTLSFHLHDQEVEPASEIDRGSNPPTAQQSTEKHQVPSLCSGDIKPHG